MEDGRCDGSKGRAVTLVLSERKPVPEGGNAASAAPFLGRPLPLLAVLDGLELPPEVKIPGGRLSSLKLC